MMFDGWTSVGHVVLRVAISYGAVILLLRLVGEQALAKMTAYDMIVTIALGSLVAEVPLTHDLSLVSGLAAILAFVGMQEVIRWSQARSNRIRHLVAETPRIVVWNGQLLDQRLRDWNLNVNEVRAAIRKAGVACFASVKAVVLENDGEWSVVPMNDRSESEDCFEGLDHPD